ncbi:MAG: hypothetical protein V1800_06100, partial [Candidatus Latescibacterota bacterium]
LDPVTMATLSVSLITALLVSRPRGFNFQSTVNDSAHPLRRSLQIQNRLGRDSGGNPAHLGASGPAVAAVTMEGIPLFGIDQVVDLAEPDTDWVHPK